jgi:tyrosine-protein phosphatase YwqE
VLAHPERYSSCSVAAAHAWRQAGAKLQVDATTLLAPTRRGERARRLVAAGMADILAGDNHGDDRTVAVAHQALVANGGEEQAEALLVRNPRAILEDRTLETVEPLTLRTTWATRLRLLLDDGDA